MINVGVIGCGYWGPNLIRNFVACPETNLICACDLEEKRLWTTCGYGPYSSHCREARSVGSVGRFVRRISQNTKGVGQDPWG